MVEAMERNNIEKIREADRVDDRPRVAFETELAIAIKKEFYDGGKTIGQVVAQFAGQRPRQWVLDVIFYRLMKSADQQTETGE